MKKSDDVGNMSDRQLQEKLNRCRADYRYNARFGENSKPRVMERKVQAEMKRRGLIDIVMSMVVPGMGRHKTGRNF